MGFNVSFSKRKEEKIYLPGQEIKISRRAITSKSYTTENDNVLTCRQRTLFALCCFAAVYLILCARVTYVCLGNGINIDTALVEMSDDDIIHFKNTVKRADIMYRNITSDQKSVCQHQKDSPSGRCGRNFERNFSG